VPPPDRAGSDVPAPAEAPPIRASRSRESSAPDALPVLGTRVEQITAPSPRRQGQRAPWRVEARLGGQSSPPRASRGPRDHRQGPAPRAARDGRPRPNATQQNLRTVAGARGGRACALQGPAREAGHAAHRRRPATPSMLRAATSHEAAELKGETVEREGRHPAGHRRAGDHAAAGPKSRPRGREEKRAEAAKLYAEAKDRRDKELQALSLELAERSRRRPSARRGSVTPARRRQHQQAGGGGRGPRPGAAEERSQGNRAARRGPPHRGRAPPPTDTIEKSRRSPTKTVNDARSEAHRVGWSEARTEGRAHHRCGLAARWKT